MTQNNPLEGYIKNFSKVCKVGAIISQICQIQGLDWLEKILYKQWIKTVLNKQDEDEEVAFILAKHAFLDYLRSDENSMRNAPITAFLYDTIQSV